MGIIAKYKRKIRDKILKRKTEDVLTEFVSEDTATDITNAIFSSEEDRK